MLVELEEPTAVSAHIARSLQHQIMSNLLEDPKHWEGRAKEARELADQLPDPEAKHLMQRVAEAFDLLANAPGNASGQAVSAN